MILQKNTNENTLPEINIQFINAIRELKISTLLKQSFPFLVIIKIYSDDVIGNTVLEFLTVYLKTVKEIPFG